MMNLSGYIAKLTARLDFKLNDCQLKVLESMLDFVFYKSSNSLFLLNGYAGTGKTTLVSAMLKMFVDMNIKVVLMAPTGRAAKVFSNYSSLMAYTVHKKIYRQKDLDSFSLGFNSLTNAIFVVDESSMLYNYGGQSFFGSGCLLDDLVSYVYNGNNNKLILIGDDGQLPPVGFDNSPALDVDYMSSRYSFDIISEKMNEVVRQSLNSGILYNATRIREYVFGEDISISLKGFRDIVNVNGEDLLEAIEDSYNVYGEEETVVICRSNNRAVRFNQGIRSRILYKEEDVSKGDRIMIVKNNYFWVDKKDDFIANGEMGVVDRVGGRENLYGFEFINLSIKLDSNDDVVDACAISDTLLSNSPALSQEQTRELFFRVEDSYKDIKSKPKRYKKVKEDRYFNALQLKYSYAITCHKAQGGQWDSVFVDVGFINKESVDEAFARWLYTAITRAKKKLHFINWPLKLDS